MKRVVGSLSVLVAALAACSAEPGDEAAGEPVVSVRDSAGISIVESTVPGGVAPVYAEVGALELEIGVVEGDPRYAFSRIVAARTLGSGEILVAEGRAQELRVYDAEGMYVRSFGGPGEGPGEFAQVAGLAGVAGDTVQVWDGMSRRVSTFVAGGRFLGDFPLSPERFRNVQTVSRMSDGTLLTVSTDFPEGGVASGATSSAVIRRVDPGLGMDTVVVLPGEELKIGEEITETMPDGRTRTLRLLLSPVISHEAYAVADDDHFYVGYSDRYAIRRYRASGELDLVLRVPAFDRPMEEAEMQEILRSRLDDCDDERCRDYYRRSAEAFEPPEMRPAFAGLQVDAAGRLWVAEWTGELGPADGWHVFSLEGELLGRVAVPQGLLVREIGDDYLLGVERNELDVPFLHRYALTRLH